MFKCRVVDAESSNTSHWQRRTLMGCVGIEPLVPVLR